MMDMSDSSFDFVQTNFLQYYRECMNSIDVKSRFGEREFAAFLMKEKMMVRHRSFRDKGGLQEFLCSLIPSDVYYSGAYYEQADASEMTEKGWIGADLIFDIDADHIPTSCNKVHDEWTCIGCGFKGRGELPQRCPVCEGERFDCATWPCEECLISARNETVKLLDILLEDFGFSEDEVSLYFSGHRGYHVHVEGDTVGSLDTVARKEIVDYICGLGFDAALHGLGDEKAAMPSVKDSGWRGRIARGIRTSILDFDIDDFRRFGLGTKMVETIMKNKEALLKNLTESGPARIIEGLGPETRRKIIDYSQRFQSAKIDTVVTTDVHRLIRLPGTLHGKTGLKKVEFSISSANDFDPFHNAIAFKGGEASVFVSKAPAFRLGDAEYGPFRDETVQLPTAAALLLICKKKAEVVE